MARTLSASAQAPRPASNKFTDIAALKAIAQAAIDVELFTIPLYMTSLYSIEGMHQINGAGNELYLGRLVARREEPAPPRPSANETGVQHRLFGLHPGDAPPADGGEHGERGRRQARFHQRRAAGRAARLDLLRAGQDDHPQHHRPQGHDERGAGGQYRAARCRAHPPVPRHRAARGRRQGGDQARQAPRLFPEGAVRRLEARRPAADVRHDRLDVPMLLRLSEPQLRRRLRRSGRRVWKQASKNNPGPERHVQQRLGRPSDARVHGLQHRSSRSPIPTSPTSRWWR